MGAECPFFVGEGFTMRESLISLLEPPILALHYELVDVEFAQQGNGGVLRLYIDNPASAITIEDCANVSRAVSEILEAADPIKGHYSLEVSSPGFDRVLRKREHFQRFAGQRVSVELMLPINGRRRFVGRLASVNDAAIGVVVDGHEYCLPLDRIRRAKLKPE